MRKIILGLLAVLLSVSSFAQEETKVRFYVKGSSEYFIRVDGELLPKSNVQSLTPGEHRLEIWSPMYEQYTGKIEIPAKDSISYYQELDKDPAYVKYLFETDKFKRKLLFGKTLPLMAAGFGAATAPILFFMRKRDHEEFVKADFGASYFGDQATADNARNRYNLTNGLFFTSATLAVGGVLTYALVRNALNNTPRPTYRQKNPFTLEDFQLGIHPTGVPQVGATFQF